MEMTVVPSTPRHSRSAALQTAEPLSCWNPIPLATKPSITSPSLWVDPNPNLPHRVSIARTVSSAKLPSMLVL